MTAGRSHLALALALLVLVLAPAESRGETAKANGFGRLAIDWEEPVTVATREGAALIELMANQPFPLDPDRVAQDLAPLLDEVSLDETRHTLRLRPANGVVVETVVLSERSIRLGLYGADAPTLRLRLGRHDGFRRLVFEPVDQRDVHLDREPERLVLTLPGRLSSADRQRLEAVPGLTEIAVAGDQLFLGLSSDAIATDLFVSPDKQVLDIAVDRKADGSPTSITAAAERSRALAALRPRMRPVASHAPVVDSPAEDVSAERVEQPPSVVRDMLPTWRSGDPLPVAVDAVERDDGTVVLRFAWPERVPAAAFVRGTSLWFMFAAMSRSIDIDTEAFTRIARRFVSTLTEERHDAATVFRLTLGDGVVPHVESDGGEWRLILGAEAIAPVAGQLARQGGDSLLLPGIEKVVALTDPMVGDRLEVGLASILTHRMPTERRFAGMHLLPSLQGAVWRRLVETSFPPRLAPRGLMLGAIDGLVSDTAEGAGLVPIEPSPNVTDLPATAPSADDLASPVEFKVAEPTVELALTTERPSTGVVGEGGQNLDHPAAAAPAGLSAADASLTSPGRDAHQKAPPDDGDTARATDQETPMLLDLARFSGGQGEHFWEQRAALLRAAEEGDGAERRDAQLDLARLLVAHGLGAEALTLLGEVSATSGTLGRVTDAMPAHAALQGAAHLLAGRHAEAVDRLSMARLGADDETALWRAAARAATGDWDAALPEWQRGRHHLDSYRPSIRAALAEHGIMLLLQTGRAEEAFATIEEHLATALPQPARQRIRLLEATALERDGAIDEARTIWRALMEAAVPEVRSQALLALVESELSAGRIDAPGAVARLVADSVHWRGQRNEVALRRKLAALQHAAGQSHAALTTLQETLSRQPPEPMSAALSADMLRLVRSIFSEFAAGERSATSVLLVYRRFAELVPPGASGDADVRQLAERLAELGLNEAAIDILRDRLRQSNARDEGRAALGDTLARLLAANGDTRGAINALIDSTPISEVDQQLAQSRRVLSAALGRSDDGPWSIDPLASIDNQPGRLRDRLRAAFDREQWMAVLDGAAQLEAALPPAGELDSAAGEVILMVATAARQLGQDAMVERLAVRYADRLTNPANAGALRLLASPMRLSGEASALAGAAQAYGVELRSALAAVPGS